MSYEAELQRAAIQRRQRFSSYHEPEVVVAPKVRTVQCAVSWPPREGPKLPMVRKVNMAPPKPPRDYMRISDIPVEQPAEVSPSRRIVLEVCKKHHFTVAELMGMRRHRPLVIARQEAFYRLATETTQSLPQIGRRMGGFDHTTVLYGIRKHKERMGI